MCGAEGHRSRSTLPAAGISRSSFSVILPEQRSFSHPAVIPALAAAQWKAAHHASI
ncbi:MAG: hypothetical protein J6N77_02015 [Lachnospiraceae bacterium]|nr:hypothetical protein [Lachnospiraceae bacterium]